MVRVLAGGQIACKKLVEMVVTVDQAREENMASKIEDKVSRRRQLGCRTDLLNHTVACEEPGVLQFAPMSVHRHEHVGVFCEQRSHLIPRKDDGSRNAVRCRSRNRIPHLKVRLIGIQI